MENETYNKNIQILFTVFPGGGQSFWSLSYFISLIFEYFTSDMYYCYMKKNIEC